MENEYEDILSTLLHTRPLQYYCSKVKLTSLVQFHPLHSETHKQQWKRQESGQFDSSASLGKLPAAAPIEIETNHEERERKKDKPKDEQEAPVRKGDSNTADFLEALGAARSSSIKPPKEGARQHFGNKSNIFSLLRRWRSC